MSEADKYKRGKSGYSVADEKAAKAYGKSDYAATTGSPLPQREREYRRDTGAPQAYLHNEKTELGRAINKKNVEFTAGEAKKYGKGYRRPESTGEWNE